MGLQGALDAMLTDRLAAASAILNCRVLAMPTVPAEELLGEPRRGTMPEITQTLTWISVEKGQTSAWKEVLVLSSAQPLHEEKTIGAQGWSLEAVKLVPTSA